MEKISKTVKESSPNVVKSGPTDPVGGLNRVKEVIPGTLLGGVRRFYLKDLTFILVQ